MTTEIKPGPNKIAGATTALVLLTAMNFVNYLDRYILPAVQEQVKGEFRLTDDQIGSLTLWFFVAYVLSSPLTGWLGDRFQRKPMIVIAALGIAAMNFFTASVHDYMSLNLRHVALGVGEASFGIFAPALLADFYAESKRNIVLTIFNVAIPVGAAMGYLAGGNIAAQSRVADGVYCFGDAGRGDCAADSVLYERADAYGYRRREGEGG